MEIEEAIIARLGARAEGAQTHDVGGVYKVVITGVVSRTLDKGVWESIKDKLPPEARPVTYEPKLDITGVKWLQEHQAEYYKIIAQAITVKPGKTSIKVTLVNKS